MKEDENKRRVEEGLSVGLTKEVRKQVYYTIVYVCGYLCVIFGIWYTGYKFVGWGVTRAVMQGLIVFVESLYIMLKRAVPRGI